MTDEAYRRQVEQAEESLIAAIRAALAGEGTPDGVARRRDAPLARLSELVDELIDRLRTLSVEGEGEGTRKEAPRGWGVPGGGPGRAAEHGLQAALQRGEPGDTSSAAGRGSAVEFAVLYDLGRALSSQLGLAQVMRETFEGVARLIDASNFYIGLLDRERRHVNISLNVTESVVDQHITVIGADEGLTGHVLRTGESLLVGDDVAGWLDAQGIPAVGEPAECWLGVPLIVGDQVQGIMAVQDYHRPHAFTEADRDVLTAIAAQASIAIQNARLFGELERRAQREQILRELTARIRGATDADGVLRAAVQTLGSALGRRVFVRLGGEGQLADAGTAVGSEGEA